MGDGAVGTFSPAAIARCHTAANAAALGGIDALAAASAAAACSAAHEEPRAFCSSRLGSWGSPTLAACSAWAGRANQQPLTLSVVWLRSSPPHRYHVPHSRTGARPRSATAAARRLTSCGQLTRRHPARLARGWRQLGGGPTACLGPSRIDATPRSDEERWRKPPPRRRRKKLSCERHARTVSRRAAASPTAPTAERRTSNRCRAASLRWPAATNHSSSCRCGALRPSAANFFPAAVTCTTAAVRAVWIWKCLSPATRPLHPLRERATTAATDDDDACATSLSSPTAGPIRVSFSSDAAPCRATGGCATAATASPFNGTATVAWPDRALIVRPTSPWTSRAAAASSRVWWRRGWHRHRNKWQRATATSSARRERRVAWCSTAATSADRRDGAATGIRVGS